MAETVIAGCGVYAMRHKATGRCYVGGSTHVKNRWKSHRSSLRRGHENLKIREVCAIDGAASFEFVFLEPTSPDSLLEREQYWMDALDAVEAGFNVAPTAGSVLGYRHSEATKELCSLKSKGVKRPGRKMSPEGRAKLSAALAGRKRKPCTAETKAKIAAARKAHTGWSHTPETRARIGRSGVENSQARLTEEDVRNIRARVAAGEMQNVVAAELGVSKATVNDLVRRKTWASVE